MTKGEIQKKAAEEMRFIMVNSSFRSGKAKDAVRNANSKGTMEGSTSFLDKAMDEVEHFSDYITGGIYQRSKLRRRIQRLTDKKHGKCQSIRLIYLFCLPVDGMEEELEDDESKTGSWKNFFQASKTKKRSSSRSFKEENDYEPEQNNDPRPKIYLAIFSTLVGFGLLESYLLKRRRNLAKVEEQQ